VIQVGTNDLRRTANLDYVMGDVYALVNKTRAKFPQARLVLSGVLRRRDMSWRRIGALNDRYDWIAKTLGVKFVDPNSWLEEWDFGRDGIHINRSGAKKLGQLYSRVCDLGDEDKIGTSDCGWLLKRRGRLKGRGTLLPKIRR
jgi:lysophospholipase L1-like esterase